MGRTSHQTVHHRFARNEIECGHSTEITVDRGSTSHNDCNTWVIAFTSHFGRHGVFVRCRGSTAGPNCCAIVRDTNGLMVSPATIPLTPVLASMLRRIVVPSLEDGQAMAADVPLSSLMVQLQRPCDWNANCTQLCSSNSNSLAGRKLLMSRGNGSRRRVSTHSKWLGSLEPTPLLPGDVKPTE